MNQAQNNSGSLPNSADPAKSNPSLSNPHSPTIFEQISTGDIPGKIIYRDNEFLAFHDIRPAAPIHILIVPLTPYQTLEHIDHSDTIQLRLLQLARRLAKELGISDNYKLHLNVGNKVQAVPHLHLHLLGGFQEETPTAL